MKSSYVLDSETLKLVPKEEFYSRQRVGAPCVHGDIDSFVSPVDGSIIGSRSDLREHNKKHGVTDMRDYGENYFQKKQAEREAILSGKSRSERQGRIDAIQEAIYKSENK
jgi:hypothetical protein